MTSQILKSARAPYTKRSLLRLTFCLCVDRRFNTFKVTCLIDNDDYSYKATYLVNNYDNTSNVICNDNKVGLVTIDGDVLTVPRHNKSCFRNHITFSCYNLVVIKSLI